MEQAVIWFNKNSTVFIKKNQREDQDGGLILWKLKVLHLNIHEPGRLDCRIRIEISILIINNITNA